MDSEEFVESKRRVKIEDVIRQTLRHWPWIVVSVVVCVGLGALYSFWKKPMYSREAQMVINDETSSGSSITSQMGMFADMGFLNTSTNLLDEVNKLQSKDVLREIITRLHINYEYESPKFLGSETLYGSNLPVTVEIPGIDENKPVSFKMDIAPDGMVKISDLEDEEEKYPNPAPFKLGGSVKTQVGRIEVKPTKVYEPGEKYDISVTHIPMVSAIKGYSRKLTSALEDKHSSTITIKSQDTSIERAEDLINTLIDVYNNNWLKSRNEVSVATDNFIRDRLNTLEQELGGVDKNIADFQSKHMLPDVEQTTSMYMQSSQESEKQILLLNNQLQMARFLRQYIGEQGKRFEVLPSNSGISNRAIEEQITKYNEMVLERNRLEENSSANHPMIQTMDNQLGAMRRAIIGAIDNEMAGLTAQIRNVQAEHGRTMSNISSTPTQANYLLGVSRQQKVKESLYLFLLQRREENELSQAFTAYNTEVILRPFGTMRPDSPRKGMIMGLAFIFGFCLPFGVTWLRDRLNTRLRSKKDLEGLSVPLVGEIPVVKAGKKTKIRFKKNLGELDEPIVVEKGNRNIINDAFRVLRTNVNFICRQKHYTAQESHGGNVVAMTSMNAASGKSFITINLAVALALRDKKVIVVDGDLRHGSSSEVVGLPSKGSTDYLSDRTDDWRSLTVTNEKLHGVDVLPIGKFPPNPTELLEDHRFSKLISELRDVYDYVLIDCPPATAMADAKIIGQVSDRTFFVIRVGLLEYESLVEIERLYKEKAYRNMALIINGTEAEGTKYGSNYYDGYHNA